MSTLLVDIGNTRIKWRILHGDERAGRLSGAGHAARGTGADVALVRTDLEGLDAAFEALARDVGCIDEAFISNVADAGSEAAVATRVVRHWPVATIRPVRSGPSACGVVNGYRDPSTLGADRWLALIGAHAAMPGHDLLVCSFGTATTIDLLEDQRIGGRATEALFVGGAILPGLDAMRHALSTGTARLPLREGDVLPFADRTEDAIASGVMAAQVGAVVVAVRAAEARRSQRRSQVPFVSIVAGGNADTVARYLTAVGPLHVLPDLVLRGLAAFATDRDACERKSAEAPAFAR